MRRPGIKPGSGPWQGPILSLDYRRTITKLLPGIEPGFRDSESPVITVTLQELLQLRPSKTQKTEKLEKKKKRTKFKKAHNTWSSRVVTHLSPFQARRCLTSEIGRVPVLSTWYGRKRVRMFLHLPVTALVFFFLQQKIVTPCPGIEPGASA